MKKLIIALMLLTSFSFADLYSLLDSGQTVFYERVDVYLLNGKLFKSYTSKNCKILDADIDEKQEIFSVRCNSGIYIFNKSLFSYYIETSVSKVVDEF